MLCSAKRALGGVQALYPPHPQKAEGILAILPGCGMDNDDGYLDHLASFCVESFGVAVALIDFHALG